MTDHLPMSTPEERAKQWANHFPRFGTRVAVYDEKPDGSFDLRGTGTVVLVDTTEIDNPVAVQLDGEPPIDVSLIKHWVSVFRVLQVESEEAPC